MINCGPFVPFTAAKPVGLVVEFRSAVLGGIVYICGGGGCVQASAVVEPAAAAATAPSNCKQDEVATSCFQWHSPHMGCHLPQRSSQTGLQAGRLHPQGHSRPPIAAEQGSHDRQTGLIRSLQHG